MHSPRALAATVLTILAAACSRDALTAPPLIEEPRPAPVRQADTLLAAAIDDLLRRVTPALGDSGAAGALEAALWSWASALDAPEPARAGSARRAVESAAQQLIANPAIAAEHGAELGAVLLVLEQTAPASP